MNTCANCRHWRPHAGSPTNMVCSLIRSAPNTSPRVILDLIQPRPADYPMILATPSTFGCLLYEDQPPQPDRPQHQT